MAFRLIPILLLLLAVLVSPPESGHAQSDAIPYDVQIDEWNADLDVAEQLIESSGLSREAGEAVKRTLGRVVSNAMTAKTIADARMAELTTSLATLGPPPEGPEAMPEPDAVSRERTRLNSAIAEAKSQISLADLTIARASALESRIGSVQRSQLRELLLEQGPLPYNPDGLLQIPGIIQSFFTTIAQAAATWWNALPETQRQFGGILFPGVLIVIGLALAWWLRRSVLRRFGPYPTADVPPYSRRLLGAIADGIARGILPAVVLAVIILRTRTEGAVFHNDFGSILGLAAQSILIFVMATALPHAALSPDDPNWRLTLLSPEQARRILGLLTPLALLFCIDEFVTRAGMEIAPMQGILTLQFMATWTLFMNLSQGALALALLRPSLWIVPNDPEPIQTEPDEADAIQEEDAGEADDQPRRGGGRRLFWRALHAVLILITIVGAVAPALGYTNLGNYLLNNMLGSAILVSILYILRGVFREGIAYLTGSTIVRENLALQHKTRSRLKFTARFLLDLTIVLLGISLLAPNWGISDTDLMRTARTALSGLQIGNVSISVIDIAMAIGVFFIVLALIRALKRALAEKILPETEIEESLRHTITAGIGYIGFVFATGIAVAVAGVDLTNVALIAGALSVGIGFGLQNIVNNFVSGLILLIERPIKVGDWVVVGPNEGFVQQINMRATEIETWQKASVIIPNADLLSTALKNWTHHDKIGRIDIPIGVALDSDIDRVCAVLLEIARAHPRCRKLPEPMALVMGVGESRIDLELRLFTSDIVWVVWIASDIRKEILRRFPAERIVIPYAQRVVHMVEGDPMSRPIEDPPSGETT